MPSPTPEQKAECCKIACDVCKTANCTTGGVATCINSCPPDLAGPVRPVNPVGPSPDGPSPDGPVNPVGPSPVGPSPVGPYGPSPVGPYGPSPDGPVGPTPVVNPVVPPAAPQVGIFSNLSTMQIVSLSVGVIVILALIILIVRNMTARRSISFY